MREILSPIKDDKTFRYLLFTPVDKQFADNILNNNWQVFRFKHYYSAIKRKVIRAASIFPTYRTIRFLRDQVIELKDQNQLIIEELEDLKDKA